MDTVGQRGPIHTRGSRGPRCLQLALSPRACDLDAYYSADPHPMKTNQRQEGLHRLRWWQWQ
eukprot:6213686-Pleurochrysis_carterae.AAC.2